MEREFKIQSQTFPNNGPEKKKTPQKPCVSLNKAIFFGFMLKTQELAHVTRPVSVIPGEECAWVRSCGPERKSNTNIPHNGHLSLSFRQNIIFWRSGTVLEKSSALWGTAWYMIGYYTAGIRDYFTSHPGCVVTVALFYLSLFRN